MASIAQWGAPSADLHTRYLCAFIEVPITLLDFEARCNYPREVNGRIKTRLSKVFSHSFEPSVPNNHVAGVVNEAELDSILRELYEEFIRVLSERYSPQYGHSDGEIFRNVGRYQSTQPGLAEDWLVRLSTNSRLPGLWEGLELGKLHKHLALRCNEEIIRYLERVGATWDLITGRDAEIQACGDIGTARGLQSLAPAISWADRKVIGMFLVNRQIFGGVRDPQKRTGIQDRLLQVDGLVPTIKTFHENMKLFSIAVKILRAYLLPERSRASLSEYLEEHWHQP
ncbi:hypothetical protein F4678DRAFT_463981 [Xylaria arbuscula]|nr:hypothetical protein F4678DRAFT_463981 [Xylaria arbuscula]